MKIQSTSKFLSAVLIVALCMATEALPQQTSQTSQQPAPANPQSDQSSSTTGQAQQPAQNQQGTQVQGTQVNPSQAPLAPVTTYPDASGQTQPQEPAQQPQTTGNTPEAPQPKTQQQQQPSQPVGAATAEKVPTAGGAAAKPAGAAIAPAKQHQTRSLLIKVGAALAAGAAIGTVYALSRGTSSTPPGANGPGAVQK